MKQHISTDQLNELSDKGKKKLREWWKPDINTEIVWEPNGHSYKIQGSDSSTIWLNTGKIGEEVYKAPKDEFELPRLSIGQMIEFLSTRGLSYFSTHNSGDLWVLALHAAVTDKPKVLKNQPELCDALWEAVKSVLESSN